MPITLTKPSGSGIKPDSGSGILDESQIKDFFKGKPPVKEEAPAPENNQQNQSVLGKIGNTIGNLLTGGAKAVTKIPVGLGTVAARAESKIPGPVGRFFAGGAQEGENLQNTTLKSEGVAQRIGSGLVDIATIFAQPELALDNLGLNGLTKLVENGAVTAENFEKIKGVVTSKWGARAVKSFENFFKGGAYSGTMAASEGKTGEEIKNEAIGGGATNVVLAPLASMLGNKLFSKEAENIEGKAKTFTEKMFGKEKADIKVAKNNPIAQEYKVGKRTIADTSRKIESAISSFSKKGKNALESVFNKLPKNVSIKNDEIVSSVQRGMEKVVGKLEKSSGATLKNINDLLTKTKFSAEEQKIVKNLVDKVNEWIKIPENTSPRGLAELRRVLYDQFNRGDGSISDEVVSKINTELKNLITSTSKEYGPALSKAVEDIDNVKNSAKEFLDKNGKVVESKLITFAKKLKDPALKADAKKVLQQTLGDSYEDIIKDLEGFNDYQILQDLENKGKGLYGTAKKVLVGAGVVGGIGAGAKETYDLLH